MAAPKRSAPFDTPSRSIRIEPLEQPEKPAAVPVPAPAAPDDQRSDPPQDRPA